MSSWRRVIDICKCVQQIGVEKCKGLIGLHNFIGPDRGGKFVGVSKKTRIRPTSFLNLADSDTVIKVFQQMGGRVYLILVMQHQHGMDDGLTHGWLFSAVLLSYVLVYRNKFRENFPHSIFPEDVAKLVSHPCS